MKILKIRKDKIISLECLKHDVGPKGNLRSCKHLFIASIINDIYIPYYCEIKMKQIIYPGGSRKCKQFE